MLQFKLLIIIILPLLAICIKSNIHFLPFWIHFLNLQKLLYSNPLVGTYIYFWQKYFNPRIEVSLNHFRSRTNKCLIIFVSYCYSCIVKNIIKSHRRKNTAATPSPSWRRAARSPASHCLCIIQSPRPRPPWLTTSGKEAGHDLMTIIKSRCCRIDGAAILDQSPAPLDVNYLTGATNP